MKISEHFTEQEFACRCGCGQAIIKPKLVKMLEEFRDRVKRPIIIHCVNRCTMHNFNVGGVNNSYHTRGMAADFHVRKLPMNELHAIALSSEDILTGGIGIYDWGVHVDIGTKRLWDER